MLGKGKREKTIRFTAGVNARQTNKQANNLQPLWHVDNMYAATIHAFCPRELNDWEGDHQIR
jgi:hypothetical protein